MQHIVEEVRQILISAKPANANCRYCGSGLRPAPSERIAELLADLEAYRPVGRTWERPAQAVILRPAPWQRARAGGRPLR